jgi:hypothetical protein
MDMRGLNEGYKRIKSWISLNKLLDIKDIHENILSGRRYPYISLKDIL